MSLKLIRNSLNICLNLVVLGLHALDLVGASLEKSLKSLLVLGNVKALELCNEISDHITNLSHILGTYIIYSLLREICKLFLCTNTIVHDTCCIADIDLLAEIINLLKFLS